MGFSNCAAIMFALALALAFGGKREQRISRYSSKTERSTKESSSTLVDKTTKENKLARKRRAGSSILET